MKPQLSCVVVAILILNVAASAQTTRPQRVPSNSDVPLKTLVYDIRSLLQPVQNYAGRDHDFANSGGGRVFGGGGGGGEDKTRPLVDAYVKLIEDTVMSESWHDNGGELGAIREIEGMLIITHTEEAHQQIDALLQQIIDRQAKLVRVRTHWLIGTREQLQPLLASNVNQAVRQIDPALLEKVQKEVIHHQAETVCFSGQTVHVTSGQTHWYVSDLNPVVANDAVAFDPVLSNFEDGAYMRVTPTIQSDGKSTVLDFHAVLSGWVRSNPADMSKMVSTSTTKPSAIALGETTVDRPDIQMQSFDTTLRLPLGTAVIVGTAPLQPNLQEPAGKQLLVVVEVAGE